MRIGFDAHVFDGRDQGTKTTTLRLIGECAAAFPDHDFFVYSREPHPGLDFSLLNLHFRPTIRKGSFHHLLWTMPRAARRDRLDVTVFNYITPPTLRRSASIIHDVLPQTHSGLFPARFVAQCWVLFGASSALSRNLFTVSDYSRNEIRRIYPWTRGRAIDVIRNGPSFPSEAYEGSPDSPSSDRAGHYVLCVGRIEPRKNIQLAIDAFRAGAPADVRLVLVGRREPGTTLDTGGDARIQERSGLSDAELVALYRGASLFLYPSMAEGFGLPLLDAILFGVPVISSDRTSMAEIGEGAACFFDPGDPAARRWLAERIAGHFGDHPVPAPTPEQRRERASLYDWGRAARDLVAGLGRDKHLAKTARPR